jgi:anaerobic magnesium-protoporphyrin IX monomethyl ester cyclase
MLKVALVQCPAWTAESPNYSLALLGALLRTHGYGVEGLDLNLELYFRYRGTDKEGLWSMDARGNSWYRPSFVEEIVQETSHLVEEFVCRIVASEAQVVGFSVQSTSVHFTRAVSTRLKQVAPDRVVIYGGPQCFSNCAYLSLFDDHPAVDAICFGEGDQALLQFLDGYAATGCIESVPGIAVRSKEAQSYAPCTPVTDLDSLPFADFSIFPSHFIRKRVGLSTSRGCLLRCRFCNESPQWNRYRTMSARRIMAEIAHQKGRYPFLNYCHFNDSLVNGDMNVFGELCQSLKQSGLGMNWGAQALIRKEMTPDVIRSMKESGCSMISYGLESGSNTILKAMGKSFTAEIAERVIRDSHAAGIYTIFNIIVGFPGEGPKEFAETHAFVARNLAHASLVSFNTLYVFQGSHLYSHPDKYGIVIPQARNETEGLGFFESDNPNLEWWTSDRTNTYPARLERLNILKSLTRDKTFVVYSDVDTKLLMGDAYAKLGDQEAALSHYRRAFDECSDAGLRRTLQNKIDRLNLSCGASASPWAGTTANDTQHA